MDQERFDQFRWHSDMLITSSNWLTLKMDRACRRAEAAESIEEIEKCDKELEYLERRAYFEDTQFDKFREEYRDFLDSDL